MDSSLTVKARVTREMIEYHAVVVVIVVCFIFMECRHGNGERKIEKGGASVESQVNHRGKWKQTEAKQQIKIEANDAQANDNNRERTYMESNKNSAN